MRKILYVEDTPDSRMLMRRVLGRRYEFFEAEDGLKGIEIARAESPDLILMDINLPHMDGHEITTRLKSFLPDVPIIALTADTSSGARERALAAGCDGYLSKPVDLDEIEQQIESFLGGKQETLSKEEQQTYGREYHEKLVNHLEEKVRELTAALARNEELNKQNLRLLEQTERRAILLEAAAQVGRAVTSILDLDELLERTVDIIYEVYGFHHVVIFLLNEDKQAAVRRAGRSKPNFPPPAWGREDWNRITIGENSLVGKAIIDRAARTTRDLASTDGMVRGRSEMALPLIIGDEVIGALAIQNAGGKPFDDDAITSLQVMADQLAIALNNARLLLDLERAHEQILRSKTFEAIATTTGETIHWVGNKAAPIPACIKRTREDVEKYILMADALLSQSPAELQDHPFAQMLREAADSLGKKGIANSQVLEELENIPLKRLRRFLSIDSIWEDLDIIELSAKTILDIKEDMIGPVREQNLASLDVCEVLDKEVFSLAIPQDMVTRRYASDIPEVIADRAQLGRVFTNLLKNALEAMDDSVTKHISLEVEQVDDSFIAARVTDTGCGIAPEDLDRIWISFYTTKGNRGGTGLGLSACSQIVTQMGGRILVDSTVGEGTTFTVLLPINRSVRKQPTT